MSNQPYEIIRRSDGRLIVSDLTTGKVLDDAQGYGYKTKQSAEKAAWYKFKGGKEKTDATRKKANEFWRINKAFAAEVNELSETWFKEIASGEIDISTEITELATIRGVDGFDPKFLKYL